MAAPILLASVTLRSTILPMVAALMPMSLPLSESTQLPAPVTVHCEVGVRTAPYSKGNRYCRSAAQKCEDVTQSAWRAAPLPTGAPPAIR